MDQQVLFKADEAGYKLHRIPALAITAAGTVLAMCEARRHNGHDDDEIDLILRRSLDGGQTWGPRQTVITDGVRTCGNPCFVFDQHTATMFLLFCKDCQQVFITQSADEGETWAEPIEISSDVKDAACSYVGTGPGHGIQLRSGRLLIPCWTDESPGTVTWRDPPPIWGKIQGSFAIYSDDHGRTWKRGEKLTYDASDECEAAELSDGRVYMTLRTRHRGPVRGFAISEDGGETWSEVETDAALPDPDCQGSIVRFDDGCMLLANAAETDRRAGLTIRLSRDDCRTWPVSRVLEPEGSAYSDMAVTRDGQILCFYESGDDYYYDELVLARFGIDWLVNQ